MTQQRFRPTSLLVLACLLCALQACTPSGTVTGIAFEGRMQPPNEFCDSHDPVKLAACTPELKNAIQFAPLTQRIAFVIQGSGTCERATLDFGRCRC